MPKGAQVEEYKITKEMKNWLARANSIEKLKHSLSKQHKLDNMALLTMMQEQKASLPQIQTHTAPDMGK